MNLPTEQRLSAFLDEELPASQVGGLCDALEHDPESRARLQRYQLIGACIRGEQAVTAGADISGAVARQLVADKVHVLAPRRRTRWLRPAAGGAIAAGVALAAIMVVRNDTAISTGAPGLAGQVTVQTPITGVAETRPLGSPDPSVAAQPALVVAQGEPAAAPTQRPGANREFLNRYLIDHQEYSGIGPVPGIRPPANLVSYGNGR